MIYTDQAAKLRTLQGYIMNIDNTEVNQERTTTITKKPLTRVIVVTSGKGGVGKTTFAVNFAILLSKFGKKVLLMDGDLGLANVNVVLGIVPEHTIYEVFKGKRKIKEIISSTHYGIDFIAGANGISQLANLTDEQRENFLKDIESLEGYDYLIIDTGAGVGQNVLGFVKSADEVLIITTPEPTAITDAYGMIKSIVVNKTEKKIHLIVNQVETAIEAKRIADRLIEISAQFLKAEVENLGFIYKEDLVQKSIRNQRPFVISYPNSKSSACILHIVKRILNVKDDEITGVGISGFFHKFFEIFQNS